MRRAGHPVPRCSRLQTSPTRSTAKPRSPGKPGPRQLSLQASERRLDQLFLLCLVDGGASRCRSPTFLASGVAERDMVGKDGVQAGVNEMVRAHVLGLLLHPPDLLGVRVAPDLLEYLIAGERIELFD